MAKIAADAKAQTLEEEEESEEKPWKGKCSFGCYHAKSEKKKCKCRCSGKMHGKTNDEHNEKLRIAEQEDLREITEAQGLL